MGYLLTREAVMAGVSHRTFTYFQRVQKLQQVQTFHEKAALEKRD
jgi:hypothetical protein